MVSKNYLSKVMKDFTDPNIKRDYLFFNGETVEADIAYSQIYSSAKKTIYVVDNYIGLKTLVLLKSVKPIVQVTIFSDNIGKGLHKTEKIFHCGGSSKDGGSRTMSISQVEDTKVYQMIAADLLKNPALVL